MGFFGKRAETGGVGGRRRRGGGAVEALRLNGRRVEVVRVGVVVMTYVVQGDHKAAMPRQCTAKCSTS